MFNVSFETICICCVGRLSVAEGRILSLKVPSNPPVINRIQCEIPDRRVAL